MGSILPNNFGQQSHRDNFTVKSETSHLEEQQAYQSSEDEFAGDDGGQSQPPDGSPFPGDGHAYTSAPDAFHFASMVSNNATSGSSTPAKDSHQPISKRTLQNRKAQREFRQRRATYLKDLEAKVRRYESDTAVIHPEVHHRINHLVQEIQYLRAIIDRLQQENADLRRLEPAYGTPQGPPSSSQATYTLHPTYSSTAAQRSPQPYDSNALALAEMYQPQYPQNYNHAKSHADGDSRAVAYSSETTAPRPSSHHVSENVRGSAGYQANPQLEWSAMRHSVADDRPRTAPIDLAAPTSLQRAEHDQSDAAPAFLVPNHAQGSYYNHQPRMPHVHSEDVVSTVGHPTSHSSSYSPAIVPPPPSSTANPYPQPGHGFPSNRAQQSVEGQDYGHLEHGSTAWHNSTSAPISYSSAGPPIPHPGATANEGSFERAYHPQQQIQQGISTYPRSNSHSP